MQLKSCRIDIKSDEFTATTFIEMEFYNPNNQEMEGLHRFELKPGQVITALSTRSAWKVPGWLHRRKMESHQCLQYHCRKTH